MRLTRRGDYALRCILDLARLAPGELARSSHIAHRQHIPPKFLPQIVSDLAHAGIAETVRGAAGGVRLARAASEISVAQVIEAVDGECSLNECTASAGECALAGSCALRQVWARAQGALEHALSITFAELVDLPGESAV